MAVPQISAPEAKARLDSERPPRVIDVREPEEWAICYINGSELLPLSSWPGLALERLSDRSEPLLLLCHHGVRSAYAAEFLLKNGFTDVTNLAGGIDAWSCEVDAAVPRY